MLVLYAEAMTMSPGLKHTYITLLNNYIHQGSILQIEHNKIMCVFFTLIVLNTTTPTRKYVDYFTADISTIMMLMMTMDQELESSAAIHKYHSMNSRNVIYIRLRIANPVNTWSCLFSDTIQCSH